jgi:malonate-semialdehyde dehydrogenase (acetylating)/methylmalonate-semialdehyde dehydrogenase
MDEISHWIGGRRVAGTSGRTAPIYNPALGTQTANVALASAAEVEEVVKVAVDAARTWGTSTLTRRAAVMFAFREQIHAQRRELAAVVTREHGKVLSDAEGEVSRGLESVEFACGIPHLLKGTHSAEVSSGVDVSTILHPVGVVAGITPFNFPVMVPLWMIANAIACGNAFILKPSEKDPSASLSLLKRRAYPTAY